MQEKILLWFKALLTLAGAVLIGAVSVTEVDHGNWKGS